MFRSGRIAASALVLGAALSLASAAPAWSDDPSGGEMSTPVELRDIAVSYGLECDEYSDEVVPFEPTGVDLYVELCNPADPAAANGLIILTEGDDPTTVRMAAALLLETPEAKVDTVLLGENWLLVAPEKVTSAMIRERKPQIMTRDPEGGLAFFTADGEAIGL